MTVTVWSRTLGDREDPAGRRGGLPGPPDRRPGPHRLALPANLAGIAAGALLAPIGVAIPGADGTLVALGAAVIAYGVLLLDRRRGLQSAHATVAGVE